MVSLHIGPRRPGQDPVPLHKVTALSIRIEVEAGSGVKRRRCNRERTLGGPCGGAGSVRGERGKESDRAEPSLSRK